jgi:hypothetical protein
MFNIIYNEMGSYSGKNVFLLGFGAIEQTAATMMEISRKWLVSQRKRFMSFVKIPENVFSD